MVDREPVAAMMGMDEIDMKKWSKNTYGQVLRIATVELQAQLHES